MKWREFVGVVAGLALSGVAAGSEPQPPKGEEGLSFRSESYFEAADDFTWPTHDPIEAVRWWGSFADEAVPGDHTTGTFRISLYSSVDGLPAEPPLAQYVVAPIESWTEGYCRGIEGLGGGDSCPGAEPLYLYEACLDPPFVPVVETEYWIGILHLLDDESRFWAWHEAAGPHPTGNEAATWSSFGGWEPGMVNACPGDFSSTVGPYDLACELQTMCPGGPGDCDGDGDADLVDYDSFLQCFTGPNEGPIESECECADMDADDDVDSGDFAEFQLAFTGSE